jgi:hypothetical protein
MTSDVAGPPLGFDPMAQRMMIGLRDLVSPLLDGGTFADAGVRHHVQSPKEWSVAIPVLVSTGVAVSEAATGTSAVSPVAADYKQDALDVLEPGARMVVVGGTPGHMFWPPETVVFDVLSGRLAGKRIEFILDPDPRPAGALAAACGAVIVRADERLLADPERLAWLREAAASVLWAGNHWSLPV